MQYSCSVIGGSPPLFNAWTLCALRDNHETSATQWWLKGGCTKNNNMAFIAVLVKLKFSEDKLYSPLILCPSEDNQNVRVQWPVTYSGMVPFWLKCDVVIRNGQCSSQQREPLGAVTVVELERVRYSLLPPNITFFICFKLASRNIDC